MIQDNDYEENYEQCIGTMALFNGSGRSCEKDGGVGVIALR